MDNFDPIQMCLPIGCIMLMSNIDTESEETMLMIRCFFASINVAIIGISVYLYLRIHKMPEALDEKTKNKKIAVITKKPPAFGPGSTDAPDVEMMTLQEHDVHHLMTASKTRAMQVAVICGIHYKWGYAKPLVISTVIGLYQMYKTELFQIHILGSKVEGKLKRPFDQKEKGGMMKMFNDFQAEGSNGVGKRGKDRTKNAKKMKKNRA